MKIIEKHFAVVNLDLANRKIIASSYDPDIYSSIPRTGEISTNHSIFTGDTWEDVQAQLIENEVDFNNEEQ